jgi:hypothetical protein
MQNASASDRNNPRTSVAEEDRSGSALAWEA